MSPTVRVGETPTLVSSLVDQLRQRLAADDAPARLVATSVHRCDEVWREPEDEPDSDDVDTDDELE